MHAMRDSFARLDQQAQRRNGFVTHASCRVASGAVISVARRDLVIGHAVGKHARQVLAGVRVVIGIEELSGRFAIFDNGTLCCMNVTLCAVALVIVLHSSSDVPVAVYFAPLSPSRD
jgi:hypothetical protein